MRRCVVRFLVPAGLALCLAALAANAEGTGAEETAHLNLVLALDASASVNDREFALQRDGIAFALRDAEVQAAIARAPGAVNIVVMQWSSLRRQAVTLDWTRLDGKAEIDALAARVAGMPRRLAGGNTMIHAGLEFAGDVLAEAPAERQVIDVSGNGHADDVPGLEDVRDRFVASGIVINGLAIEEDPGDITGHYRRHLIGGVDAFVMTARSFEDFARAMRLKLLREIGGETVENDCRSCGDRIRNSRAAAWAGHSSRDRIAYPVPATAGRDGVYASLRASDSPAQRPVARQAVSR